MGKVQPQKFPELNQQLSDRVSTEMEYYKLHKRSVYCRLTVLDCIRLYSSFCYCVHLLFGKDNVPRSSQDCVKFSQL